MSEEEEEFSPLTLFLSQISQLLSLILSHPLYFSYFLFFSPYLLKLLSFLSPLFTTTFLLLLAFFFTFSHNSHQNQLDDQTAFPLPQHIEWFNTVFNTPTEIPIIPFPLEVQEPEIKKEINTIFSHVNKELEGKDDDDHDIRENGIKMGMSDYNKSCFLGCKVFVEEDQDKMDLLWEKYEEKEKLVVEEKKNDEKSCNLKKKDLRSLVNRQKEMEEKEEEEEEEENNGKICCLQALKFSTGKVRFGMGKKNGLRKISKAFKGLKLLHQLATNGKNKTHS